MSETHGDCQHRTISVGDLLSFGRSFGIDYRFPDFDPGETLAPGGQPVARGKVREFDLAPGLRLTSSDLEVLHSYESRSLGHSPLLIVIVLKGTVSIGVGAWHRELRPGNAVSLQLDPDHALHAIHRPDQHLKTLTLALDPTYLAPDDPCHAPLQNMLRAPSQPMYFWQLSSSLLLLLKHNLNEPLGEPAGNLVLHGLALQLVGYGLPVNASAGSVVSSPSVRESLRLESVRQLLELYPAENYTLAQLASRAAMSPSSLRMKFRQAFGASVFGYLRSCRLELARRCLERGYTVQQAAHHVGYRHATNFATAFRKQFGISPSDLV